MKTDRALAALGAGAALAAAAVGLAPAAMAGGIALAALGGACLSTLALAAALAFRARRVERVEADRQRAERRGRALLMAFDTSAGGIVALDAEGGVELANAAARRMLGLPGRAVPRETWPDHARFRPADPQGEHADSPVWAMLTGKRIRGAEYLLAVPNRPEIRVRVNAEPAPVGALIGAVMTIEDVTEQHRARVMGDRAERLDALGKLTGGVAHDFNNLLSTIMGAVQLAQRRVGDDPRVTRHLETALRATRTGAELVDRLLGFAKRGAARLEDVALDALFAEVRDLAKNAVDARVTIVFHAPPPGLAARVDRPQIVTAILNLVANARDAIGSTGGTGTIRVSARLCEEAEGRVEIAVVDDGPGMAPEIRARALDPFFTTKGAARGTGLGLSMVYGATRRCGGDLRIESEPGAGATVRMILPRAAAPVAPEATVEGAAPGQGRAVLLVEDEPDLLETAQTLLSDLGYVVLPARDAAEALERLSRGHVVDVLVSDVMMPGGMSGVELAKAARRMRPDLPVVLATGYADAAAEAAGALGAPMVQKPYAIEQLGAAMRAAIARKRTAVVAAAAG